MVFAKTTISNIFLFSLFHLTCEQFLTSKLLSLHSSLSEEDEPESSGLVMRCFWFDTESFVVFDLAELQKSSDEVYNISKLLPEDPEFQDKTVLFNLCGNVKECIDERTQVSGFGQFIYEYFHEDLNKTLCRRYGGNIENKNAWSLINKSDINAGIKISLAKGTDNYAMTLNAFCTNETFVFFDNNTFSFEENYTDNIISFASKYACPKTQIYSVWKFIVDKKLIFASIMIILGLVVMILGFKIINVTIFIITCATVILVMFIFIYQYIIPSGTVDSVIYVVLAMSIIGGLAASYVVLKYKESAFGIVLGIAVAIVIGQILYNLVLRLFNANHILIQAAFYIVLIGVFAVVGKCFFKPFIIVGTSIVGSYALVRGISIFIGGFPNESTIMDLISKGELDQLAGLLTPLFYVYIGVWFVASIASSIAQFKINSEEVEEINEETESGKAKATKNFFLGGFGLDKM